MQLDSLPEIAHCVGMVSCCYRLEDSRESSGVGELRHEVKMAMEWSKWHGELRIDGLLTSADA